MKKPILLAGLFVSVAGCGPAGASDDPRAGPHPLVVPADGSEPVAESQIEAVSQKFLECGDALGRLTPRLPQECGVLAVVILSSKATARGAHLGTVEAVRRAAASSDAELAGFARGQARRAAEPLPSMLDRDLEGIAAYRESNREREYQGKEDLEATLDRLVATIEEARGILDAMGVG